MKTAAEKRRAVRRSITYPAFIDFRDGTPQRECQLCDASQEGAQLQVADTESVPEQFTLALSADGAARRLCRVIWRSENQIGVEFIKDEKKSPKVRTMFQKIDKPSTAAKAEAPKPNGQVDIDTLSPR